MPSLDKRDVRANLAKKGFVEEVGGDHIRFFYRTRDGLKTNITTKISRSSTRDVKPGIVSAMARQCKVDASTFRGLVDCTVDQDEYEQRLTESGYFSHYQ